MKNKWTGLFVLMVGVGLIASAFAFTLDQLYKICFIASGAICIIIGALMLKSTSEQIESQPDAVMEEKKYAAKNAVMSPPEKALYNMLRQMADGRLEVLAQVALVSIVDKVNYTSYRNELFRIVDFVLCDASFKPLAVIELNDSSHYRKDRMERDQKIAEILSKAKIPLVTLTPDEATDYGRVRRKIMSAIH